MEKTMEEQIDFIQQLRGRAAFLRASGEVKTPELLERAARKLEAHEALLLDLDQPEDGVQANLMAACRAA